MVTMIVGFSIAVVVLALGTRPAFAEERPEYTVYRAGTPITVDGRLDEPAWVGAPAVGAFVFPWWTEGKKEQTVAKLLWDEENLYAAFVCEDAHIWAEHTQRDTSVWKDDTVEVFTAPDPDRPRVYFNFDAFVKSPNQAQIDDHQPRKSLCHSGSI